MLHATAKRIVDVYEGKVNWVYRYFPLGFNNPLVQKEAEAAADVLSSRREKGQSCALCYPWAPIRSRPGYGDSSKAAQKQKRSKAQTTRRDAHRVRKADEKIQWYQQQFERLNNAIHDAATNELLTISDEDEKEPTTKQLHRVMYQATGLRYFYFLCIDKYNARLLVNYSRIDEALLIELANQAGASVFVCGSGGYGGCSKIWLIQ